jgi:DNA polymerase-3 subunit gamma/tau
MEIDGASNRGIDEIRELRQNVRYAAARSRFKIYYIDEVHMVTVPAFNALLKTLEEPPPHVKFIFSTTDPQKVPDTIRSRCQRFDFRMISDAEIIKHLGVICEKEGLKPDRGALQAVARAARGSMRDALSTLDQLAVASEGQIRMEDALTVLGAVKTQTLTDIADALAAGESGRALSVVHEVLFSGVDVLDFIDQISEYLRDLLVANYCGSEDELLAGAAADPETLSRQSKLLSPEQLVYAIQVLREAKLRARRDSLGRLALEIAIVKLSRLDDLVQLQEALEKLPPSTDTVAQAEPKAQAPQSNSPDASARIQNMMQKLQNRRPGAQRPEEPEVPAGIDPLKFRQMNASAEDSAAAHALGQDESLLNAFRQADELFGLEPLKVRRRKTKPSPPSQQDTKDGKSRNDEIRNPND